MLRKALSAVLTIVALSAGAQASANWPLTEATSFGSNPGNLKLFHYVPANLPEGAPLVVVAHGCTQTAQDFADTSGWPSLANEYQFAVVFPQTSTENEPAGGCFRTWEAAHQQRGAGEPLSVKQMIDYMHAQFSISLDEVFMTGMSSGGHLTNVMLATYPDVFKAGAPESSFPYKCAMAMSELATCSFGGKILTAQQWGDLARSGYPGYSGPRPKVQIWHGSNDPYIYLVNQYQLVKQWTNVHGIDAYADYGTYLLGQPRYFYKTLYGDTRVETVTIQGMGHAIAVDPGYGPWQCGSTGPYAVDFNICASYWIATFFDLT